MGNRDSVLREMFELVDRQIQSQSPPETRQAFDRLVRGGYSPSEAKRLIGRLVFQFVSENLRFQREFDWPAYARALIELPSNLERTTV